PKGAYRVPARRRDRHDDGGGRRRALRPGTTACRTHRPVLPPAFSSLSRQLASLVRDGPKKVKPAIEISPPKNTGCQPHEIKVATRPTPVGIIMSFIMRLARAVSCLAADSGSVDVSVGTGLRSRVGMFHARAITMAPDSNTTAEPAGPPGWPYHTTNMDSATRATQITSLITMRVVRRPTSWSSVTRGVEEPGGVEPDISIMLVARFADS